jgi:hypothetical protein
MFVCRSDLRPICANTTSIPRFGEGRATHDGVSRLFPLCKAQLVHRLVCVDHHRRNLVDRHPKACGSRTDVFVCFTFALPVRLNEDANCLFNVASCLIASSSLPILFCNRCW